MILIQADNSVNAVLITNYNQESESDYDNSDDKMTASISSNTLPFEPKKKTILQVGNTKVGLLIDSGSVFKILNESLAHLPQKMQIEDAEIFTQK